jgi:hypothetical protein
MEDTAANPVGYCYPLTIIADRYGGSYSGAEFLAFNKYEDEVPHEISADDSTCMNFWWSGEGKEMLVGRGGTPNEALSTLVLKLQKGEKNAGQQ